MSENPAKRRKTSESESIEPSSMIITLKGPDGETTGPQMDLPLSTTPQQLEQLCNQLLNNEESVPYAFYIGEDEIMTSVQQIVDQNNISTETVLEIRYQPLSIFRVMPVTRCTDTLPGHTEAVLHVSFSPNGKLLGSGGGDCVVRFWDVYTSTPLFECKGHKNHVLSTVWSPSGHYFISGDRNGVIIVWNPKTGKKKNPLLVGHKGYITYLCFEPLHLNKKCNRFASSSKDATVIIWNISTMSKDFLISGHSSSIECVKWGGEGLIYTASRDRIIRVWSAEEKGKLVRTLVGHAHRINSLALNTDYILKRGGYTHEDKEYKNNNINNNTIDEEMYNDSVKLYTEFMKGKNELLVSCSDDFTLYLWKGTIDKQPICRMTGHQQLVNHISFSPDGRYIASASFDKKIKIWDGTTGKFINTLTGHVGAVYQVCWSADSRILASASKDSTVKLWKPSNTHALCTLPGHADEVYTLDWSGDGERVASGSKDRTIKIWRH